MYGNGKGVAKDDFRAVHFYRLAAAQGDVKAQFCLGLMYLCGRGVEKDEAHGVHWFKLAAVQGHAEA